MKNWGLFFIGIILLTGCNIFNTELSIKKATNKVIILQSLAKKSNHNDSIKYYVNQSQKLLNRYSILADSLRIENLFLRGYYFKRTRNIDSARYYFFKTIDLTNKGNSRNLTYYKNAWEMEDLKDNLANAISITLKFIEITDANKFPKDVMYAYNYLERKHVRFGNYKESLKFNTEALKKAKQIGDIDMYVLTGISRSRTYNKLGKKKAALQLLDSLKSIECSLDSKRQLYRRYAILNFYEGSLEKAIPYYKKVIELTKKQGALAVTHENKVDFNFNLIQAYNNITETYLELKDYTTAQKYLDSTKNIITKDSYQPYVDSYNKYRFLYNYRTNKDEKEVLKEYQTFVKENKELYQKKINEKLYALQIANEKEKQVLAERNELQVRNIKLFAFSGVAVLLLIIALLFYRQRNYKFQKQEIQMQQRLLRSQMNSHFTFNTLSVIQSKIKSNQDLAANYLAKFSRLLRLLLQNSLDNYVLIEDELELLKKYLDLQLYRFPESFSYAIVLENFDEDEPLYIPPMLIQPFIENSIEHGFSGINYKGEINIKLKILDNYLECIIEDNGIGVTSVKNNYKTSVSTDLIAKFIQKTTKKGIEVIDKKEQDLEEKGTQVKFLIPYKVTNND